MRKRSTGAGRRLRLTGIATLFIALLGGTGVAASPLTASPAAAASTPLASSSPAAYQAPSASKSPAKKTPARKSPARTPSAAQRVAAVKQAVAGADADACSGAISPDTIYSCTSPSSTGTDSYTATVNDMADRLIIRAMSKAVHVYDPDGSPVTCDGTSEGFFECQTSQSGTYTLDVTNTNSAYTIEYTALLSDQNCSAADLSFAAATITGSLVSGQNGTCYTLNMPSGHVLHQNWVSSGSDVKINIAVYDATGAEVCAESNGTGNANCTPTGTAPYRVFVSDEDGLAENYQLQLNDLTDPAGCQAAPQETYGKVPAVATDRCRTLTVAKTDTYEIGLALANGGSGNATLYTQAGASQCALAWATDCQLAPGTYDLVYDDIPLASFSVMFIATDESQGCTATGETDFSTGPATGSFGGVGEALCLNLPTASGQSDYFFNQPPSAGAAYPQMRVVDSTGAQQCTAAVGNFEDATCALTGTAPFRVVLANQTVGGLYRVLTQNTASTAGCSAWAQSAYAATSGTAITLTASDNVRCLTIPATQHSTGEMIDYSTPSGVYNGEIDVNDPSGKNVCTGSHMATCSYQSGVTYTALVITTAVTQGGTYNVVRRDISQSATCGTPASTTPGGPSTTFTLTADLDARCYRIAAAATDKLLVEPRSLAPSASLESSPSRASLLVADASGAVVCGSDPCQLTSETDYQVIVLPAGFSDVAITTHLDTWKVGTADGWASQCTKNHGTAANGWAPVSGTLTESAAGYCAVVDIQPSQNFSVYGTNTVQGPDWASVDVLTADNWGTEGKYHGLCVSAGSDPFDFNCGTTSAQVPGTALLVVSPNGSPTPIDFTIQGVCWSTCTQSPPTQTITSITPSSGVAGPDNTAVVTGTGLNLGSEVSLPGKSGTGTGVTAKNQSVSADGTSLTVSLDTTNLAPGAYDVDLTAPTDGPIGVDAGTLSGAYTVTASSAPGPGGFTAVPASRILDTRNGTGAPEAPIASGGTLTLTVAGKGGVPSSGATAVALEVSAIVPAAGGWVSVYPSGATAPSTTDLNFGAGQSMSDLVVSALGDGKVVLRNGTKGTLNLTADVVGYYASGGSKLTAVTPSRILNTQTGVGAAKGQVPSGGAVTLTVGGHGGVPASGVKAVALEVTVVNPSQAGWAVAYPDGSAQPATADVNFAAGETVTNLFAVGMPSDGKIVLRSGTKGTMDLTADVVGYYSDSGSQFVPTGPFRLMDTRDGTGGSGVTVLPHAAAVTYVRDVHGIPYGATAVVLNVTVTGEQAAGTLTAFPDGTPLPGLQNLEFPVGHDAAGPVIVPVKNGSIDFYNNSSGNINVMADVEGYYTSS